MEKVYEKSGCNDCKFYRSKWDWVNDKFTQIEQTCEIGNTQEMLDWWVENGSKKDPKELTKMECHQWHDSTKILININDEASEILNLLKQK